MLLLSVALASGDADALDSLTSLPPVPGTQAARLQDTDDLPVEAAKPARPYLMEINFRGRWLTVPDVIIDEFAFNATDNNGAHQARPSIRAYAAGLEYSIRNDTQQGTFYFEYASTLIEDGYWDDREGASGIDYTDGDWIRFHNFGVMALGANYYYDMRIAPWFSFLVGGGLGVGYVLGEVQYWSADNHEEPTYQFIADNPNAEPDGNYINTPVFPWIDINAAIKFHFNDRASLRIEGGLHDMFYVGSSIGVVF